MKTDQKKCVMVGYAKDHAPDCYRFLNLESKKIVLSRDVTWKRAEL